jgi:hypothetical protein
MAAGIRPTVRQSGPRAKASMLSESSSGIDRSTRHRIHILPIRSLLIALLGFAASSQAMSVEFPPGWRRPVATDYFNHDVLREYNNPVIAELSGDSTWDSAYFLIDSADGSGGVFVRLGGSERLIKVSRTPTGVGDYALYPTPPGNYRTLDGELHFPHGAVSLREVEYGSGVVFWLDGRGWHEAPLTAGDLSPIE